ncbi:MAG TPA: methyltransferase [Woeseiaceae bacterium]|nr:methyltransferase [Woeseiaceae bacterium]
MPDMIRDGEQNAFVREFGHMAFEHTSQSSRYESVFNEAMNSYSSMQTAWVLQALEHAHLHAVKRLCDVGGGHGHTLCSFLAKYPHLEGLVLELPSVIADETKLWAHHLDVADRCEFVGGNMFEAVPSADAYMMKMILHDWNDDECVQILKNIHDAAAPGGKVFIIEHLIPAPDEAHFAKLFDIHMMCWGTGRERTAHEYSELLERAGWMSITVRPSPGLIGAVEARKPG